MLLVEERTTNDVTTCCRVPPAFSTSMANAQLDHFSDDYLIHRLGLVTLDVKLGCLPLLPRALNAIPDLCKPETALIVIIAQVIKPVQPGLAISLASQSHIIASVHLTDKRWRV